MVMRRRGGKRVPRRGARRGLRKVYGGRGRRGRVPGVHRFKEMYKDGNLICNGNSTNSGIIKFVWNSLNNAGSFQNMFDLYKITGVKTTIIPQWSVAEFGTSLSGGELPLLYIAPNRDPYVPAPTSVADVLNDDGVRIVRLNKPITMWLKNPKASIIAPSLDGLQQNFLPLQFNSGSKALQPWLTTGGNGQAINQSAIPHFGFRWYLDNVSSPASLPISVNVYHTLYFSCKEQD